jgi:hypothetical protein
MFTNVSDKEVNPAVQKSEQMLMIRLQQYRRIKLHHPIPNHQRSLSEKKKAKVTHKIPELTAGGDDDAEIATLTKLLVWSSSKFTATPNPLRKATGKAIRKF